MFYLNLFLGFVLGVGFTGLLVAYIGFLHFREINVSKQSKNYF